MIIAAGYEVSYLRGSLGTARNPVTKWGVERMVFSACKLLGNDDCTIIIKSIETVDGNNVGKVDLRFIVPNTADRRNVLLKAVAEFEEVLSRDYAKYLNRELREIEPEAMVQTDIMPAGLH